MTSDDLDRRIGHFVTQGWQLAAIDGEHAILRKPNFGSRIGHLLVFFTTVWFTAGLGNVLYALYRYRYATEYRVISARDPIDDEDALAILRRRFANGELSEPEFERRVERLLETETIADLRGERLLDRGDR